ncbi:hypothetical protein V8F20_012223, partial [Naviculisporaceae sp. PSN 640]
AFHKSRSWHCSKVRMELLIPLSEVEIKVHNCSLCVSASFRTSSLTFLARRILSVIVDRMPPPLTVLSDNLPLDWRENVIATYWRDTALQPVNVRALDAVDIESFRKRIVTSVEGAEVYLVE